jgi:AraC-like DNA-binding protein
MKAKKPYLEVIPKKVGRSIRVYHNIETLACSMNSWHLHPEVELVCVPFGKGVLHIGNQQFAYDDGVIILLNSNIPHKSFDLGFESEHYEEYVVQIAPDKLTTIFEQFPEFARVQKLIDIAIEGLVFPLNSNQDHYKVMFENLRLGKELGQFLIFFEILDELSNSNYEVLGVHSGRASAIQVDRIEKVFEYIAKNYQKSINSRDIAKMLHLTDSSFCRFFQRHTQKTFKQVLNEYRITQACKQLAFTAKSLEIIAYDCGFNNQAFFSRVFKEIMKQTPMQYRKDRL